MTVNAGARLMVRMLNDLKTGSTKTGSRFTAALEADLISAEGARVAPRGAQVYGKVIKASKAGRVRGRAKLTIELTDVKIGGELKPVITDQLEYEGDRSGTLKKVGAATAVGAIAGETETGAAVGVAAAVLTKGKQIEITAGTILEFRLTQPLTVTW
jgi:hypothetical protein